jgi:hypothetical protein
METKDLTTFYGAQAVSGTGNENMPLEKELSVYDAHLIELLVNEGKYVVICGDEINGVFDTYDEALSVGYDKYGLTPFLAKQIHRAEPIHYFSRDLPACRS